MQQQHLVSGLKPVLEQIGAWVLDQPRRPALRGQCCDRLRPARIRKELIQALQRSGLAGCRLVEWRWDQCQGRAEGWLWQNGLLQRFHWWRACDQLRLRVQLCCSVSTPLRALA